MYKLVKAFIDSVRVNIQFVSKLRMTFLVRRAFIFVSHTQLWRMKRRAKNLVEKVSKCFMCSSPSTTQMQEKCVYSDKSRTHFMKKVRPEEDVS